jgi:hypothetical protein
VHMKYLRCLLLLFFQIAFIVYPAIAAKTPKPPRGAVQLSSDKLFAASGKKGLVLCGEVKGWETGKMVGKGKAFFLPLRTEIGQLKKKAESESDLNKIKKLKAKLKQNAAMCKAGPPVPTPTPVPTSTPPPADVLPAHTAPLTLDDINHLYRRAGLGVPPDEAYTYLNKSAAELISYFMTYVSEPEIETEANTWLDENTQAPHYPESEPSATGINMYALRILAKTKNQFHERLAFLSLHDRLATSVQAVNDDGSKRYLMLNHLNLIRTVGSREMNYPKLLEQIGEDPVMVRWLSLDKSSKKAPNENYARELMELFSLDSKNDAGQDNYTNTDIIQVARAFTGWNLLKFGEEWNVIFTPASFDSDPNKIIFEGTSYQGTVTSGRDVVRHIFAHHPNAPISLAKFIAREYLKADASPEVIAYLAYNIKENNFQLRPVFEKLLVSDEFYKPENRFTIAKTPVERFTHLVRIMEKVGMPYDFRNLRDRLAEMGCVLTQTDTVFGCDKLEELPDGQRILNSANLITSLSNNNALFSTNAWTYSRFFPAGSTTPTADQVIDTMQALFGLNINILTKAAFRDYLNSAMNNQGALIVETWNPGSATMVRRKVAGLFRIMASMPQVHDLR